MLLSTGFAIAHIRSAGGSPPCARSKISVWRDGALYPLARGARGIGRGLGLVPALMVCSIDGGAGGELPGHRDRRPRDRSAGGSPPCARSKISVWRDGALYPLARGARGIGRGLGLVPALMVCSIDGGAGGELPGHRDRRPRDRSAGGSPPCARSKISVWRDGALYPLARGARGIGRGLGLVPALMVCSIDGGAGGELPGHRDRRPRDRSAGGSPPCARSKISVWRDGALYPLARGARGIGRGLGLVPALMVCSIDGGAGGELPGHRDRRPRDRSAGGSPPCARSKISVWRDGALYPLARGARGIGRGLGLVPALMVCSIDGGAGGELPGHRDRRPRDRSAGGSPPCARSKISVWRDGALYPLARGARGIGRGLGLVPALMVCSIDGGAGGELPGHRDRRPRDRSAGGSPPCARSKISVWRDGALYPLARGARGIGRGLGLVPALMVCSIDGGAGGELPGHRDRRPRDRSAGGGGRGSFLLFICAQVRDSP